MSDKTTRAGAARPEPADPAKQATHAVAGFLKEFKAFRGETKAALQQQEERLTMINAKTTTYGRPVLSAAAEMEAPHKKAFDAYLRHGDDEGLRGLSLEGKALSTAVAADGGFLVDPQTGAVQTNQSYGQFADGYFDVAIRATNTPDPDKSDIANIKVRKGRTVIAG